MAHQIYEVDGKPSIAYVGEKPWHGLGQELTAGASLETWINEAGLAWKLLKAPVNFSRDPESGLEVNGEFPAHEVLYRSDNGMPLSVVSNRYQIVQPSEVLEFFADFVAAGDMTLETAGSLDNGKKIWALARIGVDFKIDGNDIVETFVLLASSCDKSISTTGQLTIVRTVCANTMRLALNGNGFNVKVPHSRKFDADEVKQQMGLVKSSIDKSADKMRKMHDLTVSDEQAMSFFLELLKTPKEQKSGKVDIETKRRAIPKLWKSYKAAPGAEDTAWGLVNAVTHSVDFNPHARTDSARLNSAWFGQGAIQKDKAFAMASDTSFLDAIADHTTATQTALDRVLSIVEI